MSETSKNEMITTKSASIKWTIVDVGFKSLVECYDPEDFKSLTKLVSNIYSASELCISIVLSY